MGERASEETVMLLSSLARQAHYLDWNSELFIHCITIKVRLLREVFDEYCQLMAHM